MSIKSLSLSIAGAIAVGSAFHAQAASKPDASSSPSPVAAPTAPARPFPFTGKIFAIDKAAGTFSTRNREKKIRIFEISAESRITRNNKPITFEDLKAGEEVRGTVIKKGDGRFDVLSVNIVPKSEPAKSAPAADPAAGASSKGK